MKSVDMILLHRYADIAVTSDSRRRAERRRQLADFLRHYANSRRFTADSWPASAAITPPIFSYCGRHIAYCIAVSQLSLR